MYQSINPFTNELLKTFKVSSFPDIQLSVKAQQEWSRYSIKERGDVLKIIAENIQSKRDNYARLITAEMGKPLREAYYEIDKTLTAFEYYIPNAEQHLAKQVIVSNASKSYIAFEPLGVILSIMPWNFPFWQVFRFAVPSLMAGNVTVLKDYGEQKYMITMTPQNWKESNKKYEGVDFEFIDEYNTQPAPVHDFKIAEHDQRTTAQSARRWGAVRWFVRSPIQV